MGRIVIISNRLPVTISEKNGEVILKPSSGGLATGMNSLGKNYEVIWVGWPGIQGSSPPEKKLITAREEGVSPEKLRAAVVYPVPGRNHRIPVVIASIPSNAR